MTRDSPPARAPTGRSALAAALADAWRWLTKPGAELRESEQRFRDLLERVQLASVLLDVHGRITFCNRYLLALTGYIEKEELMGQNWFEIFSPPDQRAALAQEFRERVARGQIAPHDESLLLSWAGEPRLMAWSNTILRDAQGQVIGTASLGVDITQRKQAEAALLDSERKLRLIAHNVSDVIFAYDMQRRLIYVNPAVAALTGYSTDEMLQEQYINWVHPDDVTKIQAIWEELFAGRGPFDVEFRLVTKEGQLKWCQSTSGVLFDESGEQIGVQIVNRDITQRKQAEEALRENERRYRSVFEDSPISLWEEDFSNVKAYLDRLRRDGESDFREYFEKHPEAVAQSAALVKIVDVNTATLALYRAGSKAELLGNLDRIFTPESYELFREELTAIAEGKTVFAGEGINRTLSGEALHTSLRWSVVPGYEATLARVIVSLIDITERKQAEDALAHERDLLRALFAAMEDVVIVFDANGRYLQIAPTNPASLYRPAPEMLGRTLYEVLPAPQAELIHRYIQRALKERQTIHVEYSLLMHGTEVWRDAAVSPLSENTVLWVGRDITARKRAEEALQEANLKLTHGLAELEQRTREIALLNEMSDLLQICLTAEEAYAVIVRLMQQLFPAEAGALYVISASRNVVEAAAAWDLSSAGAEERVFAPDDCWALRRGQPHVVEETRTGLLCTHLADPPPATYLCIPMMAQGEALGVLHLQSRGDASPEPEALLLKTKQHLAQTVADSIALALANLKLRETLRNQSIRDPLTGLFNRRYMEETLERELRRVSRVQRSLGIIMLDVDHFKQFNDTFGHDAGDVLLRELSGFLRAHIRGEDVACRYGGEEFTLILPEATLEVTQERAARLCTDVKHLHAQHEGQPLGNVTLSLGVALFPAHGDTRDAVLRAADAALYRAKRAGRDRVVAAE